MSIKYIFLYKLNIHNVYSFSSIIRKIKSSRMRWATHIALMGSRGMPIGYW